MYFAVFLEGKMDTIHSIQNCLIRIDGKSANSVTYWQAWSRQAAQGAKPTDLILGGRYQDIFEKRQDQWRIIKRNNVLDWFRPYTDSGNWETGAPALGLSSKNAVIGSGQEDEWAELQKALLSKPY
jgi:hypothetical protein